MVPHLRIVPAVVHGYSGFSLVSVLTPNDLSSPVALVVWTDAVAVVHAVVTVGTILGEAAAAFGLHAAITLTASPIPAAHVLCAGRGWRGDWRSNPDG